MHAQLIFWPVLAVALIPIAVLLLNGKRKSADRKTGDLDPNAAIDNKAWSLPVVLTSNSLANQFQLPVIFYVLSFVLFSIGAVTTFVMALACVFALSRWIHAYVHVTSNYIPHRMGLFILGAITLLILFGVTFISLLSVS